MTWMRLVHPREGAPDVRVMYVENTGPRGSNVARILQVEVATFTRHSSKSESLGAFLFRTKLDPSKKAYAADTVIVIFIQAGCTPDAIRDAHDYLHTKGARGLCYLLGQLDEDRFQVAQVLPRYQGPLTISLDEAFASEQAPVAQAKRGMSSTALTSAEPIPTPNPFLEYS
jgi:hypothetical protein